jgi:hypothetical protein
VECVAQLPKGVHKHKRFQENGHGWPQPLFIATQANRAVVPLRAVSARSPDRVVLGMGHGGDLPNGQIPMTTN